MNDLDTLDRFGPKPTDLSAAAMSAARARLDAAMTPSPAAAHRPRRRLAVLAAAAAAAAAVGLAVTPAFIGSDNSIALAAVDPLTFPLTPTGLPDGLDDPVFERDVNSMAARYGPALNGVSIVTDVKDDDYWSIPDNAPTAEINGHRARVVTRTVHNGTANSAPAVTVIWQGDSNGWTAVTGSGGYADAGRVEAIAESLGDQPQQVELPLSVAPKGWTVVSYREDRIVTLAGPGDDGRNGLAVALVDRLNKNLSEYAAQDVETLTINGEPAQLGRRTAETADAAELIWVLEAQTSSGQAFSLQAPPGLTRDQVIQIAEGVTYRP